MNPFNYKEKINIFLISVIIIFLIPLQSFAECKDSAYLNAKAYGYYANGEYDSAISAFKKAIKIYPSYAPLYDGIADSYIKKRQLKKALYNYSKASKLDPANVLYQIHIQEAVYFSYLDNINQAELLITKASSLSSENPIILDNIKKIQNNNFESLKLMTNVYQNSSDVNLSKGNSCLKDKDYKNAIKFYILSASKNGNFEAYNNIGVAYLGLNKPKNASMYFKKALISNANPSYVYNNLGIIYFNANNLSLAIKYFNFAIKTQDSNPAAHNNKAVCNLKNIFKNIDKPIKRLNIITGDNPDNVAGLKLLGEFYYLAEKYNLASTTFKSIVDLNNDNIFFLEKLADSYLANGEYQHAITYYKKYTSSSSSNADVYVDLARAYEKNEDFLNAFSSYQTALRVDSKNPYAYKYFGYFLLSQKREQEAKGILRKYLELSPTAYDYVFVQNSIRKIP